MKQKAVRLEDYGVSPRFGFLSPEAPADHFSNPYYEPWDTLNAQLAKHIKAGTLEKHIQNLPALDTSKIISELEWRRAYVVLSFLIHGWVWYRETPQASIPASLAEPYLSACKHLGQEPVVSYSALCLWNWKTKDGSHAPSSFDRLENLECLASFTGSHDEDAFYLVPDMVEAAGGALPGVLLRAIDAARQDDSDVVAMALVQCAETLKHMAILLGELTNETCEPNYFFTTIRPFLAGGKGMESKGLPNGFVFERGNGETMPVKCVGGSAVQSALFPAIDAMLGIEHTNPMFAEMRAYMPGKHREFLAAVKELPSLRSYVSAHPESLELQQAYDKCIDSLKAWRTRHIALVTRYIVLPAKKIANEERNAGMEKKLDAGAGTAGSPPVPFLKQVRDETQPLTNAM